MAVGVLGFPDSARVRGVTWGQWLQVQGAVRALLTPYLYRRLADAADHVELLSVITAERSSPLVVWTPAMRTQLRGLLTAHREAQPVSAEALADLAAFRYTEVEHELVVEEVYVRLFVEVRRHMHARPLQPTPPR